MITQSEETAEEREFEVQQHGIIERKNSVMKRKGFVPRQPTNERAVPIVEGLMVCSISTCTILNANFSESDPSEEPPAIGRTSTNKLSESMKDVQDPLPSSQPATDASPAAHSQTNSHKKGGRPPHGRKGKLGKNQYTRDKDQNDGDERSPGRSQSRDVGRGDENGHNSNNRTANSDGKLGKSKSHSGSKTTMVDMKRKVAAMLDFISRTQLEMAGESLTPTTGEATKDIMRGLASSIIPILKASGEDKDPKGVGGDAADGENTVAEKDFKDLTILEMMDYITGQCVKWQNQFV